LAFVCSCLGFAGFCFLPRLWLWAFVLFCLVLLLERLSIAPHCLPLISPNPPSPSAEPPSLRHSYTSSVVARRKPHRSTCPQALLHHIRQCGGDPPWTGPPSCPPKPAHSTPHLWAAPGSVGPLSGGGSHRIRWGVWERGGEFEGHQGGAQGIGV